MTRRSDIAEGPRDALPQPVEIFSTAAHMYEKSYLKRLVIGE